MSRIQLPSNYLKHTSKNPIQQLLINNFYKNLIDLAKPLNPETILDAGCGEGFSLAKLSESKIGKKLEGIDYSREAVALSQRLFPTLGFKYGSIYSLPYKDNSFDLVVCTEVLEHLDDPQKALSEVLRVSKKYILFSVPNEPFFMGSNFLRGKNLKNWGNNPEHINHWTIFSFLGFLKKENIKIKKVKLPFPWIMVLVEKYSTSSH